MKKIPRLPTLLGVLVLAIGLASGMFLINSSKFFKLGAQIESSPKNVRISNISTSSITVSWVTDVETEGFVKWGTEENTISEVALEEGREKSFVHSVSIIGIEPLKDVYFKINSGSRDFDNQGIPWQAKTSSQNVPPGTSLIGAGSVLDKDETTPAKALVYLTINGVLLSSLTSDAGSWVIPISSYVSEVTDNTTLELSVNAGEKGTAQAVIYPKAIKATPVIILGKTYDFRTIESAENKEIPESSVSIPEKTQISSRFEVGGEASTSTTKVSLDSIKEGEIINTTDPEFFGTAPKDVALEIVVESEAQSQTITPTNKGTWSWSPPNNLTPGEHTVTLKWRDGNGILRTIKRTFIVQAGEMPAFVSTPSATPITTPTSSPTTRPSGTANATATATSQATATPVKTATSTPTRTAVPTSTATNPPVPDSGDLTPTLALFLLGMSFLLGSIFVWKKA